MPREFTVFSGKGEDEHGYTITTADEKMGHFKSIIDSVSKDAQGVWGELWRELQGSVTDGFMVLPDAESGFVPKCGWPEFLEKIWLLKHYIDYMQKFSTEET